MEKEKENDIDSLARMVAEGFSSMSTQMNERFSTLEERFDGLEERFDGLEERFDGLEGRFDGLEKTVQETNRRIDTLVVPTLDSHAHRIKKLEEQIA